MRIAHLADVHLGFRQFQRQTPAGINQREADVAAAFQRAIDGIIEYRPDIVLIAGDLFHSVRPSNPAILHSFNQLKRLRDAVPDMPIVVIAGNHDTPRSVETGAILKLFEAFGDVFVVTGEPERLTFPDLELSVLCVPHSAVRAARPVFSPDAQHEWNILLTHGEVAGVISGPGANPDAGGVIEPEELQAPQWSYVALGHYHVAHAIAPNAWFSGSLEYLTSNSWGELKAEENERRRGKGWLAVELAGELTVDFRPVQLNRKLIDLPPVEAAGMDAETLNQVLAEQVTAVPGGIRGHVVRQLVWNVNRAVGRELDPRQIREFKMASLNYNLDLRRPEPAPEVGLGTPTARQSVPELLLDYLKRAPLDSDVDRKEVIALAQQHLGAVELEEDF